MFTKHAVETLRDIWLSAVRSGQGKQSPREASLSEVITPSRKAILRVERAMTRGNLWPPSQSADAKEQAAANHIRSIITRAPALLMPAALKGATDGTIRIIESNARLGHRSNLVIRIAQEVVEQSRATVEGVGGRIELIKREFRPEFSSRKGLKNWTLDLRLCWASKEAYLRAHSDEVIAQRKQTFELRNLFKKYGHTGYAGENVSLINHAVQTARILQAQDAPREVIAAGFIHDVGMMVLLRRGEKDEIGTLAINRLEQVGCEWARQYFPERVANLIGGHVAAKRYLAAVSPEYVGKLSAASKKSLELQGGPFQGAQRIAFERDPDWKWAVMLREADDLGKDPQVDVKSVEFKADFESFLRLCDGLMQDHAAAKTAAVRDLHKRAHTG